MKARQSENVAESLQGIHISKICSQQYIFKESFIMNCNCNGGFGGGNCCWIIIILIVLFFCCGNGCNGGNICGSGC